MVWTLLYGVELQLKLQLWRPATYAAAWLLFGGFDRDHRAARRTVAPAWKACRAGPSWVLTCMLAWPVVAVAYRCSPWLMARRPSWAGAFTAPEAVGPTWRACSTELASGSYRQRLQPRSFR